MEVGDTLEDEVAHLGRHARDPIEQLSHHLLAAADQVDDGDRERERGDQREQRQVGELGGAQQELIAGEALDDEDRELQK
jgi:hypothetical protein